MLWLVAAVMTAIVIVAIIAPFLRSQQGDAEAEPAEAYDLRLYRAQLADVDRDIARGTIAADEAERLKAEIGRKVLEADRALARARAAAPRRVRRVPALAMGALAVVLALGAFAVYDRVGQPALPDQPLLARIAEAQKAYDTRPSQAKAEAAAPAQPQPDVDPAYRRLVEQLREVMAKDPNDARGLDLLAQGEMRLGNPAAAAEAMRRLIALRGNDAGADDHARLAGLMAAAAGGVITPETEAEIDAALSSNPAQPQARYLRGLLMAQTQRPDLAFSVWRDLLEENPSAPWAQPIRAVIGDLAWLAGHPDYEPPPDTAGKPAGPDAGQIAAAEAMSPAERQAMIDGMVSQLQERLASEGGTPAEWARLVGALRVQGRTDDADAALAQARAAYAGNHDALAIIDAAANGNAAGAETGVGAEAGAAVPGGAQDSVTLAARLEARLASQGGTPAEWARLIIALSATGKADHAREILAEARQKFAADRAALATLDSAAEDARLQ